MSNENQPAQPETAPDAAPEVVTTQAPIVLATFSSHPVQNFRIANFQFEKGVLKFEEGQEESLEKFEKLIAALPIGERNRIQKIDVEAAEKLIEKLRAKSGGATQKIDSTVGERVNKPQATGNLGAVLGRGN